jgi:hypothetical protein
MLDALAAPRDAAHQVMLASGMLLSLKYVGGVGRVEAGRNLIAAIRRLNELAPVVAVPPRPAPLPLPPAHPRIYIEPPRLPRRPEPLAPRRSRNDEAQLQQEILGSRGLLLEILKRAANDWTLYRLKTDLKQRQLADDAYVWLFQEEPGHPVWVTRVIERRTVTAFVVICELLELDPEQVRAHIRQLRPEDVRNAGRPPERRRLRREDSTSGGG